NHQRCHRASSSQRSRYAHAPLRRVGDHYLRGAGEDYASGAVVEPLILRAFMPMAQQDKTSILGPRDDGTYIVEFRTAAGERLAISVPGTKAAVLKHFQAATAEPHIPTPDGGVMTGMVKPEIRNVLQIGWTVVRGIL